MAKPSSLPASSGMTSLTRLGGAGRGRNHVDRGGAGSPQIFVREVEDDLIVGIGVDGGHGAADDLEVVVDDLGDRGQTIRRAGSVRDDVVLGGIVFVFVHAEHNGEVFVLRGGGDDDFFHGTAQMLLRFVGVGELSGGLDHDLSSDGVPGQGGGIFFLEDLDTLAVDRNIVGAGGDLFGRLPRIESYLSRCARVLGSVRSLTATKSRFLSASAVRRTLRPMRPNPLMPTFTAMVPPKKIDCLRKYAVSWNNPSMVTGWSSQRKCHAVHPCGANFPELGH
jgi:hypothetical protein